MTNIIKVDFKEPTQTFEQMTEAALERYAEMNPFGVQLIASIGDTDVLSDNLTVYVKVDGETVLSFSRNGECGLVDLIKALNSQVR